MLSHAANLTSILSVAMIVGALGIRLTTSPQPSNGVSSPAELLNGPGPHPPLGSQLKIPGVDFLGTEETVIIAISTECALSVAGRALYQELAANRSDAFQTVAVLPEQPEQARAYLDRLDLQQLRSSQANLATIGVHQTPTIVVADRFGHVRGSWEGKLSDWQMADVRRQLGLPAAAGAAITDDAEVNAAAALHPSDLRKVLADDVSVVDIRTRDEYAQSHVSGSLNIPFDELWARMRPELPPSGTIVVMCGSCASCEGTMDEARLQSLCLRGLRRLTNMGFSDVRLVMADLPAQEAAAP
jgi:hypothetical protein